VGRDTPPMTRNCSFLHHSSMPTPLHLISRIPVAKIEIKERNEPDTCEVANLHSKIDSVSIVVQCSL
jgi:hypothetical protein